MSFLSLRFGMYFLVVGLVALAMLSLFTGFGLKQLSIEGKTFLWGYGDLLIHFGVFYLGGVLLFPLPLHVKVLSFTFLLLVAVASEYIQANLLPGRTGSLTDALVNVFALFSAMLTLGVAHLRVKRSSPIL
ncbi:hypothetical protein K6Q96_04585 [Grimontia kaedaensis]|uniref:VanZ-like domain-containing protein n=1 Tax=Grimontia kaedaensis TaxID=2872157 RepID=A0ABY4WUL8_9GAMM|nr:hypothetical protein [Grimontia kaedaensis]USH03296.1 hypothetical protein K6Q96_04585 [Grimontia kaedaensis]